MHIHQYERHGSDLGLVCTCGDRTTARGAVEYDAFHDDPCESFAGLMINRQSNTGGGRPSDAARYVVKLHAGLGCEGFRARYEQGAGSHVTLDQASWSLVAPF
jgi:hypothetical protein